MIIKNLNNNIAVFPLSNAVFFPRTTLPLNIFEDKYLQLVNDCIKTERMFGMVQPKTKENSKTPEVYKVGCLGKITEFVELPDKRFSISLSGIIRFRIKNEIKVEKLYRKFNVDYSEFLSDLEIERKQKINYDRDKFLKKLTTFFIKINYPIVHAELEKLNIEQLINTVSMISPFSVKDKQKLIETIKIDEQLKILDEIINFNLIKFGENNTIQ